MNRLWIYCTILVLGAWWLYIVHCLVYIIDYSSRGASDSAEVVSNNNNNWRPLDQHRIDSRLVMMYKVTYDLVAIPVSDYLVQNTRASRHIHSLAYRQIQTLKDYYRFTFSSRTIIHWNAPTPPANIPTLHTRQSLAVLSAG